MFKILKIAEREFLETVKTKMFVFSLILTPLLLVIVLFITGRTQRSITGPRPERKIAVTDLTGKLASDIRQRFERYNGENPHRRIALWLDDVEPAALDEHLAQVKREILEDRLHGYFVLTENALESSGTARYYAKTRNITDLNEYETVQRLIQDAVVAWRYRQHNLSSELIARLRRDIAVERVDVEAKPAARREPVALLMVPFFFLILMFAGVFGTNQQMLTSVVEEKNSRVMEMLLSAVTPFQLMAGKIVGLAAVGLLLVAVWGAASYVMAVYRGLSAVLSPAMMAYFLIYFVLGFLLIASALAAIGAACNTVKEAQTLMGPITIVLVLPMIGWFYIAQNPDGWLAVTLSFIPPITPMIMILRIAADPDLPFLQILATILLLLVSVPAVMWASAKIFRVGILMYGKPPSLGELAHWLKYR